MAWYSHAYWGSLFALGQQHRAADFGGSFPAGLAGVLVSPARGLLVFTPALALALLAMVRVALRRSTDPFLAALAAGVLLLIAAVAKWEVWWGGHTFGPRLLIETLPALMIFLGVAWKRFAAPRRAAAVTLVLLIVPSVYFQLLGARYYPSGFNSRPNDIDLHPERLWEVRDTELARCSRAFAAEVLGRPIPRTTPPLLPPASGTGR